MAGVTAFVGLMGSGKSYTAIELAILPALKDNRKVITNIPLQLNELEKDGYDISLISQIDLTGNDGFNPKDSKTFEHCVFHELNLVPGAVYVLDELWRIWRTKDYLEAHLPFIKMHRHISDDSGRSIDIFLVTQNLSDIQVAIRDMVETTIITKKMLDVGFENKFNREYYRGSVKGVEGIKSNFIKSDNLQAYRPELYKYYKSHINGNSSNINEARIVKSSMFSGWRFKLFLYTLLFLLFFVAYQVYKLSKSQTFSSNPAPIHHHKPSYFVNPSNPAKPINSNPVSNPVSQSKPIETKKKTTEIF